jgi:hypothetical protein
MPALLYLHHARMEAALTPICNAISCPGTDPTRTEQYL